MPVTVALDRLVTFMRRETTLDPTYRSPTASWVTHAEEWAEMRDLLPSRSESVRQGMEQAVTQTRVRIRYRDDITADMRMDDDVGRSWQIVGGPSEIGRREYLEVLVEIFTTTGGT